ncbi:hypothetical protein E4U28_005149 [Claviceps purpurea]|nr:hypothetical protein E4U28_005149 [Claviceps purpurea]
MAFFHPDRLSSELRLSYKDTLSELNQVVIVSLCLLSYIVAVEISFFSFVPPWPTPLIDFRSG